MEQLVKQEELNYIPPHVAERLAQATLDEIRDNAAARGATTLLKRAAPVLAAPPHGGQERKRPRIAPAVKMEPVEPRVANEEIQEESIDSGLLQEEIYETRLRRAGRDPEKVIGPEPRRSAIMRYVSAYESGVPWFETLLRAADGSTCLPKIPVLTRAYIAMFMREPRRGVPTERACANLDREPFVGEAGFMCESFRLSREKAPEFEPFKARELLMPEDLNLLEAGKRADADALELLPRVTGWCYLCHLRAVTELYLRDFNRVNENLNADDNPSMNCETLFTWYNAFMVATDRVGEYKLEMCLSGDGSRSGVYGPFPAYRTGNYAFARVRGAMTIVESDALVFRLSRA